MRRTLALTIIGFMFVGTTGCSTIVKRGAKEMMGASSEAQPIPGTAASGFTRFGGVDIATPKTDLGTLVDARFKSSLTRELRNALTRGEEPVFVGGTPILSIEPEITWYHKSGSLGGIMGSDSFAVVLFWLKADGADMGRVQVVTKSEASRTGPEDLAKSMAEGLAKYFKKQRKKK